MEFALCINTQSPSDDHHLHGERYRHDGERIWDVRNEHALLDFESPDISLPSLPHVCEFSYQSRRIHPNALRVLCDAMPFLRETTWDFSAPERRFPELRKAGRFVKTYILLNSTPVTNLGLFRQYRRALVSALSSLSFSHLQSFDLVWGETEPSNDNYISPIYLDEDESTDNLSCALRRISQLPTMRSIIYYDLSWTEMKRKWRTTLIYTNFSLRNVSSRYPDKRTRNSPYIYTIYKKK